MNVNSDSTYNLIKTGLDASTLRGKLIANNIANVNTEGYKRYYLDFDNVLNNANENLSLKTTKENHIGSTRTSLDTNVKREEDLNMNSDENNVDLDLEKVDQAANTMMYNALISRANGKLSTTKYIISGGN